MPEQRLLPILIATLAERRMDAGGKVRHVAARADVSEKTIYNFEAGVEARTKWPDDTDEIVNAYAEVLGTSPYALWIAALDRMVSGRRAAAEPLTDADAELPEVPEVPPLSDDRHRRAG